MMKKRPIYPQRVRRISGHFSWVDHRLVRGRHIESCSHPVLALCLFLVTVADEKGLREVRASCPFRVIVHSNHYSVPSEYAGSSPALETCPDRICIYRGNKLVALRPRSCDTN